MVDFYSILGVPSSATREEIHAAYTRQARRWHPDVCKDPRSSERMTALNQAWMALKDPPARAAYDRARAMERLARMPAGPPLRPVAGGAVMGRRRPWYKRLGAVVVSGGLAGVALVALMEQLGGGWTPVASAPEPTAVNPPAVVGLPAPSAPAPAPPVTASVAPPSSLDTRRQDALAVADGQLSVAARAAAHGNSAACTAALNAARAALAIARQTRPPATPSAAPEPARSPQNAMPAATLTARRVRLEIRQCWIALSLANRLVARYRNGGPTGVRGDFAAAMSAARAHEMLLADGHAPRRRREKIARALQTLRHTDTEVSQWARKRGLSL